MEMGMRKVLGLVGGVLLLAGPALAADLSRPPPYKAPPPVLPVFSWTGWYIGGNAGYGWGSGTNPSISSDDFTFDPGTFPSVSPRGFIGGGQIGYNWQVNPSFVLGLETDFQGADIKGSGSNPFTLLNPAGAATGAGTASLSEKLDFFGSARARAGLAFNNWLLYGSGGLAYGNVKSTIGLVDTAPDAVAGSRSETRVGWAAGGGVNYAMTPNWILGVDFLHYDLGHTTVTGVDPVTANSITASQKVDGNIVRGVIDYKF